METAGANIIRSQKRDGPQGVHYLRHSKSEGQHGRVRAPRHTLLTGKIARRDWLRFLTKMYMADECHCQGHTPHQHWYWRARKDIGGYGQFSWQGRDYPAHRFAYIALRGPIPDTMEPDHLCRIRHCANPDCIELVTPSVNQRRGKGFPAANHQKTHCPQGHPYSGENLEIRKNGNRRCKTCKHRQLRATYYKRKAKEALQTRQA